MKKFLILVLLAIASTQIVCAESYQRWVYWVSPVNHEVTATEMAEITSLLYDNKIVANKEFSLSSGTRLKIPQPSLYLSYIEKAVRAANPAVLTKDDVIFCLNDSEKMKWGNDVTGSYKNYYYSYAYKGVRFIDNFSGEGKGVDFLFINGIPAIKCDCGNPIENKNPQPIEIEEVLEAPPANIPEEEPVIVEQPKEEKTSPIIMVVRNVYERQVPQEPVTEVRKSNWVIPVIVLGGLSIVAGIGYLIYSLINNSSGGPGGAPIIPPTPGGPGGTPPSGGGGPGGAPV